MGSEGTDMGVKKSKGDLFLCLKAAGFSKEKRLA